METRRMFQIPSNSIENYKNDYFYICQDHQHAEECRNKMFYKINCVIGAPVRKQRDTRD